MSGRTGRSSRSVSIQPAVPPHVPDWFVSLAFMFVALVSFLAGLILGGVAW